MLGLYRDNGKENGGYYIIIGLYRLRVQGLRLMDPLATSASNVRKFKLGGIRY